MSDYKARRLTIRFRKPDMLTRVNLALRQVREEEGYRFKTSLDYKVSSKVA